MANLCPYAVGNGKSQYKCPILSGYCRFQHWCTVDKLYKLTSNALKCSAKVKKENK